MSVSKNIKSYFDSIDKPLFWAVIAISVFSIINIYGIVGSGSQFFMRQIIFVGVGLSLMIIFSLVNYRYLKNYSFPSLALYLLSIVLLFLTFYSSSIRGTNAWIVLGNLTFEPSELAKLMLIVLMAKYFSQRHVHISQFKHIFASGIYFAIPTLIVLNQPDLGSALIFILIWLGMLFASGINKNHIFLLFIIGLAVVYLSWIFFLEPYQKDRIISFVNPQDDPYGSGYNIIQSRIAIGSGFLFGNGLGNGSQSRLGFLPEPHNDFVFASSIEQFGLLGAIIIISLLLFILVRLFDIALRANNNFGKLFCVGLSIFIFSHIFISSAVNVGLLPVTGIPFTFLSYGGSHLVVVMSAFGIAQSIKRFS